MFPSKYNEHHMLSTGFPTGFSVFLWELMPIDSVDHSDCVIGQCTVQYLCALLNLQLVWWTLNWNKGTNVEPCSLLRLILRLSLSRCLSFAFSLSLSSLFSFALPSILAGSRLLSRLSLFSLTLYSRYYLSLSLSLSSLSLLSLPLLSHTHDTHCVFMDYEKCGMKLRVIRSETELAINAS